LALLPALPAESSTTQIPERTTMSNITKHSAPWQQITHIKKSDKSIVQKATVGLAVVGAVAVGMLVFGVLSSVLGFAWGLVSWLPWFIKYPLLAITIFTIIGFFVNDDEDEDS
jgi:hypothetical protein